MAPLDAHIGVPVTAGVAPACALVGWPGGRRRRSGCHSPNQSNLCSSDTLTPLAGESDRGRDREGRAHAPVLPESKAG